MGNLQTLLGKDDFTLSPYVAWQQPDAKTVHRVEQRVIKQLLQALIFENIVSSDHKDGVFTIYAYDHEQRPVEYHAFGQYYLSFGLVRLDQQDVIRQNDAGQQSRASLNLVLDELVHGIEHAEKRDDFIYEMKRTFIHDLQSQICQRAYSLPASQYSYEELETYLMEGTLTIRVTNHASALVCRIILDMVLSLHSLYIWCGWRYIVQFQRSIPL